MPQIYAKYSLKNLEIVLLRVYLGYIIDNKIV